MAEHEVQQQGNAHPDTASLLGADPALLGDAMVQAAMGTTFFQDMIIAHDAGYDALDVAYRHVITSTVAVAGPVRRYELCGDDLREGDLRLRAGIGVAGQLAMRMAARDGVTSADPRPRWRTILEEVTGLADEDPKGPETDGGYVRGQILTAIAMRPYVPPTEYPRTVPAEGEPA